MIFLHPSPSGYRSFLNLALLFFLSSLGSNGCARQNTPQNIESAPTSAPVSGPSPAPAQPLGDISENEGKAFIDRCGTLQTWNGEEGRDPRLPDSQVAEEVWAHYENVRNRSVEGWISSKFGFVDNSEL